MSRNILLSKIYESQIPNLPDWSSFLLNNNMIKDLHRKFFNFLYNFRLHQQTSKTHHLHREIFIAHLLKYFSLTIDYPRLSQYSLSFIFWRNSRHSFSSGKMRIKLPEIFMLYKRSYKRVYENEDKIAKFVLNTITRK